MSDEVGKCPRCGAEMHMQFASRGRNAGKAFWGCSRFPQCKGSRNADGSAPVATRLSNTPASPAETSNQAVSRQRLRRGDLLVSRENTFGPGKLIAREDDRLVLEYFDTPGQNASDRYTETVSRASLKRLVLSPELRVFWEDASTHWRSGRIIETNEHGDIYVRGHEWEGFVPEERLFVRWDRPLDDPVGFADSGLLESPQLAELRRPFLQSILRQRSASHGMRAALSSCVELHEHQIETAWRVLQDPVQRYLLADEVGLGKTIEAGLIIRQLLLDKPKLQVQLILPPFLVDQWRRELTNKFRIHDFPRAQIRFARDDEPDTWEPADLVVIDEAHNLARLAASAEPELAARFERLAETAIASPRLLMLSATPALHNEHAFLAMLKLLDPAVYGQAQVEDLRARLLARAGLGRLFLGLQPGIPGALLRNRLTEISASFADDPEVTSLARAGLTAVSEQDDAALVETITALRTHVSEVYRVHRRMLRTRRTAALEESFRVTGRDNPARLNLDSKLHVDTTNVLDQWREEVLASVENDPDGLREAGRALAAATALSLDPAGLRDWATQRTPLNIGERDVLDRVVADLVFANRRTMISRPLAEALTYLFSAKERVVVFCPTPQMASEVASELRRLLPAESVLQHLSTDPPHLTDQAVRAFEKARTAAVLVADFSAEEGRNLQFVDLLIHVGVPAGGNRLEQRIGRCDRWNPQPGGKRWRSFTVRETGDDDSYAGSWDRILREGFGVYGHSIASLQQAVDDATDAAWRVLLARGPEGTEEAIDVVRRALRAEVEHVREQDALDSLESTSNLGSVFNRMKEVEDDAPEFAVLTHNLVSKTGAPGNLRFEAVGNPISGVGSYDVIGKMPGRQAQIPLIPAWRLLRDFLPLKEHRGTFVRSIATELTDVHLYRYGDQFIDAVSDFLSNDDRGRAYGMWRWLPLWARAETPVYRFDYAVEANPLEFATHDDPRRELAALSESEGLDRQSLTRRTDGLFPPLIVTMWMDVEARPLTNRVHLDALATPYRKPSHGTESGGDYALNRTRIERAYEVIPATEWAERWRASEAAAQRLVRSDDQIVKAIANNAAAAERDATSRIGQLRLRAQRSEGSERRLLHQEIHREEVFARALATAITNPVLRLDSTGLVILSGRGIGEDQ